ncbi:MAG: carboxypeptidase regulatory-like domain-containing protein [Prevotella sp.]|nr:carboxypeptidase regulatory-like domain-containing protein [Prevotella sp.]
MQKRLLLLVMLLIAMTTSVMAQITTSGISGKVTSQGEDVIGATITAIHQPSGTVYRAVTNIDGRYTIQGMRVGGPYKVEVAYIGQKTKTFLDVTLRLGETEDLSCSLQDDSKELQEVVVTGSAGVNATKTGAAQSLTSRQIADMPSITHGIADVARLNPQLTTSSNGAMSFAGTNNRYNSFMIDGAMNNDVFGLTADGSNGGQAGTQPVSMETIEQIQVNVAPFDVRQSGFTGGAINAITKSGTNKFHGSVYGFGNNQSLIGHHYPYSDGTGYAPKYQKQEEYQWGVTLGGPIVKDKLFFFVNYENTNKSYPNLNGYRQDGSRVNSDEADEVLTKVKEMAAKQGFNYDGAYSNPDIYTKSNKIGAKIDWNINDFNKFSFRWSLVDAKQLNNVSGASSLNDDHYFYPFTSKTNSFTAELQSRLSPVISNEARASYVRVRDKRNVSSAFPMISLQVTGGSVNIGNERSSMANSLDQDIYTLEDNLTWYNGNHTFTFGTHNEFYKFANLFIQDANGTYNFADKAHFDKYYDDFMNGTVDPSYNYFRQYRFGMANVEITGDPRWKAPFSAGQLGFYAQDKWNVNSSFQLTYGLRMEIPLFFDTPTANVPFNEYAASRGWGVRTDHKLSSTPLWSPRVGFRWDINKDRQLILRGGLGVFTGRIPYVWISNNFTKTGLQMDTYSVNSPKGLELYLDPNGQLPNAERLKVLGNQEVDVFVDNFKFAQTLKANLGFDFHLLGIDWTADAIYSKTLNDIYYKNLAVDKTGQTFGQATGYEWDNRPMFDRSTAGSPYSFVYALYNTNKGYTVNLSLKAEKHFNFGLDLMASYTWTRSMSVNSGTSSVAGSNWMYNTTYRDANDPELGFSAYNVPHRVQASAYYHVNYGAQKQWETTVGLIYQGRSGSPYVIEMYGDMNGDGATGNDIMWIPTDAQIDKMKFAGGVKVNNSRDTYPLLTKVLGSGFNGTLTEDQQRQLMKQWIAGDSYLRDHRGEYFKRYADNLAFEHHFDVHLAQKYSFKVGGQINSLELSFDIINIGNLLNKDWGHTYGDGFGRYFSPFNYEGNGLFKFDGTHVNRDYDSYYSRWRGQLGLRYTF